MGEQSQSPMIPANADDTGDVKGLAVIATRQALHTAASVSADSESSLPTPCSGRRSFLQCLVTMTGGVLLTAGINLNDPIRADIHGLNADAQSILDSNGQPVLNGNRQIIQGTKRNAKIRGLFGSCRAGCQ